MLTAHTPKTDPAAHAAIAAQVPPAGEPVAPAAPALVEGLQIVRVVAAAAGDEEAQEVHDHPRDGDPVEHQRHRRDRVDGVAREGPHVEEHDRGDGGDQRRVHPPQPRHERFEVEPAGVQVQHALADAARQADDDDRRHVPGGGGRDEVGHVGVAEPADGDGGEGAEQRRGEQAAEDPESSGRETVALTLLAELDSEARDTSVVWGEVLASAVFEADLRDQLRDASGTWSELVARAIAAGVADGSIPEAVDPLSAAERLTALVDGLSARWLAGVIDRERARELLAAAVTRELS